MKMFKIQTSEKKIIFNVILLRQLQSVFELFKLELPTSTDLYSDLYESIKIQKIQHKYRYKLLI